MIAPLVTEEDVYMESRREWDPSAEPFSPVEAEEKKRAAGKAIDDMLNLFYKKSPKLKNKVDRRLTSPPKLMKRADRKAEEAGSFLDSPRLRGMRPELGEGGRWTVGGRGVSDGYVVVTMKGGPFGYFEGSEPPPQDEVEEEMAGEDEKEEEGGEEMTGEGEEEWDEPVPIFNPGSGLENLLDDVADKSEEATPLAPALKSLLHGAADADNG